MNLGVLFGAVLAVSTAMAMAYTTKALAQILHRWVKRLHVRVVGLSKHRRKRQRALQRHRFAAAVTTGILGIVALIAVVPPLKGGTIPFAPGTDFTSSLMRGLLIVVGTGIGFGLYMSARQFARTADGIEQTITGTRPAPETQFPAPPSMPFLGTKKNSKK